VGLLLEEIFKRLPGIEGTAGGGRFDRNLRGLHVRSRCGILLYRSPEFVERALIPGVFGRNPGRNRLRALELRSGIKETALLATMQFKTAFRTFSKGIEPRHKNRSAIGTSCSSYCPHHSRRARTKVIRRASWSALWRLALPVLLVPSFLLFGIPIAAVTVLAIHKRLRPSVATDCNYTMRNNYWIRVFSRDVSNQNATNARHTSLPFLKLFWNAA
jgi:hypothetical protein